MGVESELNHPSFRDAFERKDIASLARQIVGHQFLLIHLAEENESEEVLGALTAEYRDEDYLVVFTTQENASEFVECRSDLFDSDVEVSGFWVDGQTMLDYLDDDLGVLINPDTKQQERLDSEWVRQILDELNLQ